MTQIEVLKSLKAKDVNGYVMAFVMQELTKMEAVRHAIKETPNDKELGTKIRTIK